MADTKRSIEVQLKVQGQDAKRKLDDLQEALEDVEEAAEDAGEAVEEAGDEFQDAGDDAKAGSKGIMDLGKRIKGSFAKVAASVAAAGTALAGLKMIMEDATKKAMEFGIKMAEIATLSNASEAEINSMSESVLGLAANLGLELDKATKGLYDITSAGYAGADGMTVLNQSAVLAKAGVTDIATSADLLTSVLNAYTLEASDAEYVSDKLFATVRAGKTTIAELAGSVGMVAPLAATAGVSLEDMLAAVAQLTKVGMDSATATTYLRGVLTALIKPQEGAINAAKKYGIELNANILKTHGVTGTIKLLTDALGDDAEAWGEVVPTVQGLTASLALAASEGQGMLETLDSIEGASGDTANAFGLIAATTQDVHNNLKAKMNVALVKLGQKLLPLVNMGLEIMLRLLGDFEPSIDKVRRLRRELAGLSDMSEAVDTIDELQDKVEKTADEEQRLGEALEVVQAVMPEYVKTTNDLGNATSAYVDALREAVRYEEMRRLREQSDQIAEMVEEYQKAEESLVRQQGIQERFRQEVQAGGGVLADAFANASKDVANTEYRINELRGAFGSFVRNFDDMAEARDALVELGVPVQLATQAIYEMDWTAKEATETFKEMGNTVAAAGEAIQETMAPQAIDIGYWQEYIANLAAAAQERNEVMARMNRELAKAERAAGEARAEIAEEQRQKEMAAEQAKADFEYDVYQTAMSNEAASLEEGMMAYKDYVRQLIKSELARAVARAVSTALGSVPFPFNIALGGAAAIATSTAFNSLIPAFRHGVTNFGGGLAQVHRDEILSLPPGTDVVSQAKSRNLFDRIGPSAGRGQQPIVLKVSGDLANLIDKIDVVSQHNRRSRVGPAVRMASRY